MDQNTPKTRRGLIGGRHYTDYVDEVKDLRQDDDDASAESLVLSWSTRRRLSRGQRVAASLPGTTSSWRSAAGNGERTRRRSQSLSAFHAPNMPRAHATETPQAPREGLVPSERLSGFQGEGRLA